MEIKAYHLNQTVNSLKGPSKEQIIVFNQWAAVGFNLFHQGSSAAMDFTVDKNPIKIKLSWDSEFSADAMKERKKIAEEGGVSLAFFIMSVLLGYKYLQQSEIGEGVDYRFQKEEPATDNFFADSHYVEISGLLEENGSNTLLNRIRDKHKQIGKGIRRDQPSSVIVTLFESPITVKELHR
jgi:hypothetical protein